MDFKNAIFIIVASIVLLTSFSGCTESDSTTSNETGEIVYATIQTNYGNMTFELYPDKAPITVENFKKYAESGFYEGTIFHRVISDFMIQGGGFTVNGTKKETIDPIKNEAKNGLSNKRGTIAMARTNIVDSATSQFFINTVDNSYLDYQDDSNYGYAVFGKMIDGFDVLEKIENVATANNGQYQNWPIEDVIIEKVKIEE
ncbi:peptidylprolyl isomerase [Methanococcus maripaludis]|uniref:peptidylprolyl isomerase n=1 Tax=Methanococcus maripaludis TaxID=39152 RepID=A0A2L1CCJ0_METMI|nr:peptidylprolyl isomerase [Methanococcus maripaludis]AVB77088.1 Peptidyl-prolyl cis-trans isomerase B [Methanococcus maripaludis]MBA2863600.1 peptidyl-prolyl cis-trans isomerase B (cyclophilin B) [Methanococcus maripaludis]MBB6496394.1 peptidyl-prolyl cis-trans isomerase B (cyclophilin B) [Methanococcus maripaludis]